jgi:hypothetical protein
MTRPRDHALAPRLELLAHRAIWFVIIFVCVYLGVKP